MGDGFNMRLTLILILLLSLSAASRQEQLAPETDLANAPLVKLEELFAHPERYDRRIVRVNALWVNGYHGAVVCPIDDEHHCIGASLECPKTERCKEMDKVLQQSLKAGPTGEFWDKRGRLSVVGRFKDTREWGQNSHRFVLKVLNVEGVSPKPSGNVSAPDSPFDTYGNLCFEDEKARLDNFAIALQQNPDFIGLIFVNAGNQSCAGEARYRADRARKWIGKRGIKPGRIIVKDVGFEEEVATTLLLWPKDKPPYEGLPGRLARSEVKIFRHCRGRIFRPVKCPIDSARITKACS